MLTTILIFLVVLTVLVFVHELGHFVAAKRAGAQVLEFGFGFPPRLIGVKRGNTVYSINWIPLGGFVRIKGESGDSSDPDSFTAQSSWKRFLILISGVGMNIALAVFLLTILFAVGAPTSLDQNLPAGAHIQERKIQVLRVVPGSSAEKAGLQFGDSIISIDGQIVMSVKQVQEYNANHAGIAETVVIQRGQEQRAVTVTPIAPENGKTAVWGIGLTETGLVRFPWYQAIFYGFRGTFVLVWQIIASLFALFADMIVHHKVAAEISGPVGIATMTGQVAQLGFLYLVQFSALLSINLAVINILPIPSLDGGRVLFLLVEKFRKRPIAPRTEALIHNIGFATLLGLIALVTVRDVGQFGDKISSFISTILGGQ